MQVFHLVRMQWNAPVVNRHNCCLLSERNPLTTCNCGVCRRSNQDTQLQDIFGWKKSGQWVTKYIDVFVFHESICTLHRSILLLFFFGPGVTAPPVVLFIYWSAHRQLKGMAFLGVSRCRDLSDVWVTGACSVIGHILSLGFSQQLSSVGTLLLFKICWFLLGTIC